MTLGAALLAQVAHADPPGFSGIVLGSTAALVVGDPAALTDGDLLLRDDLQGLGYVVVVKADTDPPAAAPATTLVVLAPSARAADLGTRYLSNALPVLALGNDDWQNFTLTSGTTGAQYGTSNLIFIDTTNPIASGLPSSFAPANSQTALRSVVDGSDPAAADDVAVRDNGTSSNVLFTLWGGQLLADGTTPAAARRVALGFTDATLADLTPDGLHLLDNAVQWVDPYANPGPDETPTESLVATGQAGTTLTTTGRWPLDKIVTDAGGNKTTPSGSGYANTAGVLDTSTTVQAGKLRVAGPSAGAFSMYFPGWYTCLPSLKWPASGPANCGVDPSASSIRISERGANGANPTAYDPGTASDFKVEVYVRPNAVSDPVPTGETPNIVQKGLAKIPLSGRQVTDASTTAGSTNVTSPAANFTSNDVGRVIAGLGIPVGSTIKQYINPSTVSVQRCTTTATTTTCIPLNPNPAYPNGGLRLSVGEGRRLPDATWTTTSPGTLTSPSGAFTAADIADPVTGVGLPAGTTITAVTSTTATLSATPTASQSTPGPATVGILCNGLNPCPLSSPNPDAFGQATLSHDQWKISYTNKLLPSCHVQGTAVDRYGNTTFGKLIVADQTSSEAALGHYVTDGQVTTSGGTTTVSSATATFYAGDIGKTIGGLGIPPGTTIKTVASDQHSVTLSQPATSDGTAVTIDYTGTGSRPITATTAGTTLTALGARLVASEDAGRLFTGTGIPAGTYIKTVIDTDHATLSASPTGTVSGVKITGTNDNFRISCEITRTPDASNPNLIDVTLINSVYRVWAPGQSPDGNSDHIIGQARRSVQSLSAWSVDNNDDVWVGKKPFDQTPGDTYSGNIDNLAIYKSSN